MIERVFGDGRRSLFLVSLLEPRDNCLSVVLLEAKPSGPETDRLGLGLSGREIVPEETLAIEVEWDDCILYSVCNETYSVADPAHEVPERMLVERLNSRFLDYVFVSTWARNDYPGPVRHWALFCENHVIDVACVGEPAIRRVPIAPQWLDRDRPRVFQR